MTAIVVLGALLLAVFGRALLFPPVRRGGFGRMPER